MSVMMTSNTLKFASNKLYKATVDMFPGAIYLLDGSIDFLACALCLALYASVKRHERIYGTLGRKQNSRRNHSENDGNKEGMSC